MYYIFLFLSIAAVCLGALTFRAASDEASEHHDYEPLRLSMGFLLAGVFLAVTLASDIVTGAAACAGAGATCGIIHCLASAAAARDRKKACGGEEARKTDQLFGVDLLDDDEAVAER